MSQKPAQKPKVISSTEMVKRAQTFVAKWKDESREHAESQSWWNEFFDIFGVDRYSTAVFERWATRASTGNKGRIDVFMPGVMIAEHKSLGRDLGRAGNQADDYLAGGDINPHEMPRYVVTTDFKTVQIDDLESPLDPPFSFDIRRLPKHVARFAFISGYQAPRRDLDKQTDVSIKAARAMGALYEALLGDVDANEGGHVAEHAAIFMTRLLFLMFGDDADGLWEAKSFQYFIEDMTAQDGSDTGAQIAHLFQILDTPTSRRSDKLDTHLAKMPYVNGGLFKLRIDIPTFDSTMRDALLKACKEDWSEVSPAIFGSLFQGMSSRQKRREHGEHYTTEANILKTLRPLFLDDLEIRLQEAWNSDAALAKLHDSFTNMRYVDPACGSGNFLIVAYREMRDLELRLMVRRRELRGETNNYSLDATWDLKVSPDQFGGIEINWWPAKIAETAMFLVDHQANQRMSDTLGAAPERLPITLAAKIVHDDALRVDWADVFPATGQTLVFGNPPFIGQYTKTPEQTASMKAAWGEDYDGYLDFVTSWHAKALAYLKHAAKARFAFVTTNSIVQGQPVAGLFRPIFRDGWRILFAHRTFAWRSEATGAAAVHCVIVGFAKEEHRPRLFDYESVKAEPTELPVDHINAYLLDAPDVFVSKRMKVLSPSLPEVTKGSVPADGGNLLVSAKEYEQVAADPIIAPYLRRFVGARELIHNEERWCIWITNDDHPDVSKSTLLRSRLEAVRNMRAASSDEAIIKASKAPARFQYDRQPAAPYLCIPRHFSEDRWYLTLAHLEPDEIAGDSNFTAVDPDGLAFAAMSSSMFITWQQTIGGRLESRLRFASTVTWNTFPFPALSEAERDRIVAAGHAVLKARELQAGTKLADLYHPLNMSKELLSAHETLDRAVDRVFGFAKAPSEVQRQQRLFERYLELTHPGELTAVSKALLASA